MTTEEKPKLLRAMRKARLDDIKKRLNQHRAANRLRARLNRNMFKRHAEIGRAGVEALGIDMESLREEHLKADILIKRQLSKDRKSMKQNAGEVRRDHRRKLVQGLRSAAAFRAVHRGPNPTCIWRASNHDRIRTGDPVNEELINFDYGSKDGRNDINFRIKSETSQPGVTQDGTYLYLFDFYYERQDSAVVLVGSWAGGNGFLTARSSLADVCCGGFRPASLGLIDLSSYIAVTTIDANGNLQLWDPVTEQLGRVAASGQDCEEERVTTQGGLEYPSILPVIGGTPVVITVGVQIFYALWGTAEIEAEFHTPSAFEADVPYVVLSSL